MPGSEVWRTRLWRRVTSLAARLRACGARVTPLATSLIIWCTALSLSGGRGAPRASVSRSHTRRHSCGRLVVCAMCVRVRAVS